jgi:hypothetical protein
MSSEKKTYNIEDFSPQHICDVRLTYMKQKINVSSPKELSPQLVEFMTDFTMASLQEHKRWKIGDTASSENNCFEIHVKKESKDCYKICFHVKH